MKDIHFRRSFQVRLDENIIRLKVRHALCQPPSARNLFDKEVRARKEIEMHVDVTLKGSRSPLGGGSSTIRDLQIALGAPASSHREKTGLFPRQEDSSERGFGQMACRLCL